jgi:hypothetical protein
MLIKRRVKLTYPQELLREPLLYRLIVDFQIVANVLAASVTSREGWFVLEVEGPHAAVLSGLEWMAAQGIEVEQLPAT